MGPMTNILLVEDDPLAAQLILSLLGSRFGEVRRVAGAAEALCAIENPDFAGRLRLVISGRHTKGIGGPAFVAELLRRKPHLPVLVLGAPGESPADYTGEQVTFLPRHRAPQQVVTLAGQMLARESAPASR